MWQTNEKNHDRRKAREVPRGVTSRRKGLIPLRGISIQMLYFFESGNGQDLSVYWSRALLDMVSCLDFRHFEHVYVMVRGLVPAISPTYCAGYVFDSYSEPFFD